MLGFDFHLTEQGPKLIEINTNAGGLATVFTFAGATTTELKCLEKFHVEKRFFSQVIREFEIAREYFNTNSTLPQKLTTVAIVDENVEKQGMYPEMLAFKQILESFQIKTFVISPEDVVIHDDFSLSYQETIIDFIYNRITSSFRLSLESHSHLRKAALNSQVVISPHPAAYVRIADKRNLLVISDKIKEIEQQGGEISYGKIVPQSFLLSDRELEYWVKNKKNWVFKPAEGCASKGVYRGDKLSAAKLKTLPPDTIAQEFCPPSVSAEDATKLDFRVFSRDNEILGLATRHFTGQVMEMSSAKSGFKMALPENVCCFPMVVDPILCAPFCAESSSCCTGDACCN